MNAPKSPDAAVSAFATAAAIASVPPDQRLAAGAGLFAYHLTTKIKEGKTFGLALAEAIAQFAPTPASPAPPIPVPSVEEQREQIAAWMEEHFPDLKL